MKQKPNQIREETRKKVAATFRREIKNLRDLLSKQEAENKDLRKKYVEVSEKLLQAEDEVNKYKDWCERLQDYVNLSEEDRQKAMEQAKMQFEANKDMHALARMFGRLGSFMM